MTAKTVLVFRTSVTHPQQVRQLQPLLNALIAREGHWNFDLEDCDHILRVETQQLRADNIAMALRVQGFRCEEL